jgi:hypothetical protein
VFRVNTVIRLAIAIEPIRKSIVATRIFCFRKSSKMSAAASENDST